ncbi:hypothetical protein F5B22DRAFT_652671 [Xylaria bambusicola]|uniref:uncharacterized protein n=1 Tax=Xylaria bambusicola TaxID=326684 RepID=UPI002007FF2D|nr:uncharacterized protein F5B22DRAFT_652671 [Xylaria bambusicola]KAI0502863.1 hypothetical protein F5B22DRAFT_652671 [Xylaria bambusicola]
MSASSTGLSQETRVSTDQYLGAGIAFIVITSVGVALRFVPIRRWNKIHTDDYVSVIALVFLIISLALTYRLVGLLADPNTTISQLLQWSQITNWFTTFTLWSSKAPILLLYTRLFGVKRWVKLLCYSILILIGLVDIAGGASVTGVCSPRGRPLTAELILNCSNASSIAGVALGIVSVITDGTIFIIPLPIIYKLQMNTRRKISLLFVFATGSVAIIVSALAVSYKYSGLHGSSSGLTDASLAFLAECAISIAVSCAPAIHACWSKLVVPSTFYSRVSSAFSRSSVRAPERSDSTHLKGSSIARIPSQSEMAIVSKQADSVTTLG